jgi:RNA-directed DNA polymerase
MGKPAATDRPYLRSLSHSFTLDFVVLCNGTKEQAHAMKEELGGLLSSMGLQLSEAKTKVTHITEGFDFRGYRIMRSIGTSGKMIPKVLIPAKAITRLCHAIRRMLAPNSTYEAVKAKIIALNSLIRGWCAYYRCTNSPGSMFNKVGVELFWDMAHWLGKKIQVEHATRDAQVQRREYLQNPCCTTDHAHGV